MPAPIYQLATETLSEAALTESDGVILLFNSIHRILRVEKILTRLALPFRLIATPRPLFSDCGMAIVLDAPGLRQTREYLDENQSRPALVYARREGRFFLLRD